MLRAARHASSAAASASPCSTAALLDLESIVGAGGLSVNESVIENHGSLERGYVGWSRPQAVVFASSTPEVAEIVKACAAHRVPIVPYGAGTSVEGHIDCPAAGTVMLDLSRMDSVLAVHEEDFDARVQAGVTREALNEHLRATGLTFTVDPGANATLGGMVATNASGTTTLRYGAMKENVASLQVVMADGSIVEAGGRARKSSAGYDLTRLLIGSEGTLGVVTEVGVRLHPQPEATAAAVCHFETLEGAVGACVGATYTGAMPARMELLDAVTMAALDGYQGQSFASKPTVFWEFHGSAASVEEQAATVGELAAAHGGGGFEFATATEDRARLWKARHDAFWAVKARYPGLDVLATDVAVPISRLPGVVEATHADVARLGITAAPLFGHVGDGNFHLLVVFDAADGADVARVRELEGALVARAIAAGGTCTGEHGVGTAKLQYLDAEFGAPAVDVMGAIKRALDPLDILNPGKAVPRNRL